FFPRPIEIHLKPRPLRNNSRRCDRCPIRRKRIFLVTPLGIIEPQARGHLGPHFVAVVYRARDGRSIAKLDPPNRWFGHQEVSRLSDARESQPILAAGKSQSNEPAAL